MSKKRFNLFLFAGLLALLVGCKGDYTDVSNDPRFKHFNSLIGKEFRTKVRMYVMKVDPSEPDNILSTSRDIGIPGIENVKEFPYHAGPQDVYGILPAGSTYRVTKAIQRNSSTMGGVDWRAVITSSGPFLGWAIRTSDVVSSEIFGPNFKYENVEEAKPTK